MTVRTPTLHAALAASSLALLVAGTAAPHASAQFFVGEPTDDVWAYDFASDPGRDPVIRVWGDSGVDVNPSGYPGTPFSQPFWSYGFASWDLSDVPPGYRWEGATLTLTVVDGTVYDADAHDIYVRLLTGPVDETTWVWGVGPAPVYGDLYRLAGDDSQVANGPGSLITFDIPKNLPVSVLRQWAANRRIDLAITSDCQQAGDGQVVRFASNNNLLFDGPILELK